MEKYLDQAIRLLSLGWTGSFIVHYMHDRDDSRTGEPKPLPSNYAKQFFVKLTFPLYFLSLISNCLDTFRFLSPIRPTRYTNVNKSVNFRAWRRI